jgi:hypothetical protein
VKDDDAGVCSAGKEDEWGVIFSRGEMARFVRPFGGDRRAGRRKVANR